MRILFDQGVPAPLRDFLTHHEVATAYELGWSTLNNGAFLTASEESKFNAIVTTDKNLRFQQDLSRRPFGVVVLPTTSWKKVRAYASIVVSAVDRIDAGQVEELEFPD